MQLLPEDDLFLKSRGYEYILQEWSGNILVIIHDYEIPALYSQSIVELMVMVPPGYPMAPMDMFWVFPEVRLVSTNTYPPNADYFQHIEGRRWQRFSRHYTWRPGIDSLASHLATVNKALKAA